MTKAELAHRMMVLAIKDTGLPTTEALEVIRSDSRTREYSEGLKARALSQGAT